MSRAADAPVSLPADARCPECGAEPTEESARRQQLSNLGYLHQDIKFTCDECGHEWAVGVPIGEFDRPDMADDLRCGSCGAWMLVHRVQATRGRANTTLHLKCPVSDCHTFKKTERDTDDSGVALIGYPQITGQTQGCDPYGYRSDTSQ